MSEPEAPVPSADVSSAAPQADVSQSAESPRPYQSAARPSRLGHVFFAGLVAFFAGLAWYYVEQDTGVTTKVWMFLSLIAILVPPAWHAVDIGRAISSRRGQAFGFVVTTIVLGLVVVGFVGWGIVTFKSRLPSLDLTRTARYSLSEELTKLLERVPGTVYATYLQQGGTEPELRQAAMEQLRVYEAASSHVRVADVDAFRDRERANQILKDQGAVPTKSGEDTDIVVLTYAEPGKEVAPGKQKEIKVEPWAFRKTSSTGEDKWLGESLISGAVYELVFQKYRAYATAGHGERSLSTDFRELRGALTTQNVDVAQEPLMLQSTPNVPDDCELLIVLDPTAPFATEEAEAVARWMEKGRTLLLAVDLKEDRMSTGLEVMLDKFGVHTRTNYEVVAPQVGRVNINQQTVAVAQRLANNFPVYGSAYADHPAAQALRARGGLATYFVKSTYVEVDDKPPAGAKPEVVCYAPDFADGEGHSLTPFAFRHFKGRVDFNSIDPSNDKSTGKFPLIVTSVRSPKEPAGHDGRIVVSGDADVFSDRVIANYPANLDLVRGLVQWGLRREGLVAVSDRTLEDPYVSPTEYQRRFALGWPLLVCFLPLVAGGMVWWSRRR